MPAPTGAVAGRAATSARPAAASKAAKGSAYGSDSAAARAGLAEPPAPKPAPAPSSPAPTPPAQESLTPAPEVEAAEDREGPAPRADVNRPAPVSPSLSLSSVTTAGNGAGFLLGLIGYALFVNYMRGGPAQARGWLSAKFLNRPGSFDVAGPTSAAADAARQSTAGLNPAIANHLAAQMRAGVVS